MSRTREIVSVPRDRCAQACIPVSESAKIINQKGKVIGKEVVLK